jgi:hypothetical protein
MQDDDFNTLTDDQKKEFVFGKVRELTTDQFEFAKNTSGYFNSLDFKNKIMFCAKTKKSDLLEDLIKKSELTDNDVEYILSYALNEVDDSYQNIIQRDYFTYDREIMLNNYISTSCVYKIVKIIINTRQEFSNGLINILLRYITNNLVIDELIKVIIGKMPDSFEHEVKTLMHYAQDKAKIAEIIINKLGELSDFNFNRIILTLTSDLTASGEYVFNVAKMLIDKKTELNSDNIDVLMRSIRLRLWSTDEMARLIINKKPDLSGEDVFYLIKYANIKEKIVELLGSDNINKINTSGTTNIVTLLGRDYQDDLKKALKKYYTGTDPYIMRANGVKEKWSDAEVAREELKKLLSNSY